MSRNTLLCMLVGTLMLASGRAISADDGWTGVGLNDPAWMTNYDEAMTSAKLGRRMLLVYFYAPADKSDTAKKVESILTDPKWKPHKNKFVFVKVPLNAQIRIDGKLVKLLDHPAYAELRNGAGIAMVDWRNRGAEYYGYVVTVLPMESRKYYSFRPEQIRIAAELPPGTLTQRSMILAVRMHPERPASARGKADSILLDEAKSHSRYQAQITVQGHHQWDSRFQRILSRFTRRGRAETPCEVVAESWPNQDLMDSCFDCVDAWRHSDGHWAAVNASHESYGYDIRRGSNGIWYATGLFGN